MKQIWISGIAMLVLPGAALAQLGGPLPVIGDRPPTELPRVPTVQEVVTTVERSNPVDEDGCVVVYRRLQTGTRLMFDSCDVTDEIHDIRDAEGVTYFSDGQSHEVDRILGTVTTTTARYRYVLTREIKLGGGSEEGLPIVGAPPAPGPVQCVIDSVTQ